MSGSINPLLQQQPPQPAPVAAPVAQAPAPMVPGQALASHATRGRSQEQVLRRRDAAGGEMAMLAKIANDPNPTQREVEDYIVNLLRKGHIEAQEAGQILASMPRHPAALRHWARTMFSAVMHEGIHAEAAFPREHFPSPPRGGPPGPPETDNV